MCCHFSAHHFLFSPYTIHKITIPINSKNPHNQCNPRLNFFVFFVFFVVQKICANLCLKNKFSVSSVLSVANFYAQKVLIFRNFSILFDIFRYFSTLFDTFSTFFRTFSILFDTFRHFFSYPFYPIVTT